MIITGIYCSLKNITPLLQIGLTAYYSCSSIALFICVFEQNANVIASMNYKHMTMSNGVSKVPQETF